MMRKKAASGTKRWIGMGGTQLSDKERRSEVLAILVASLTLLGLKPDTHIKF